MTKFKFWFSSKWVSCKDEEELTLEDLGLEQEDWDSMTEEERESFLNQEAIDWAANYYEFGAHEI